MSKHIVSSTRTNIWAGHAPQVLGDWGDPPKMVCPGPSPFNYNHFPQAPKRGNPRPGHLKLFYVDHSDPCRVACMDFRAGPEFTTPTNGKCVWDAKKAFSPENFPDPALELDQLEPHHLIRTGTWFGTMRCPVFDQNPDTESALCDPRYVDWPAPFVDDYADLGDLLAWTSTNKLCQYRHSRLLPVCQLKPLIDPQFPERNTGPIRIPVMFLNLHALEIKPVPRYLDPRRSFWTTTLEGDPDYMKQLSQSVSDMLISDGQIELLNSLVCWLNDRRYQPVRRNPNRKNARTAQNIQPFDLSLRPRTYNSNACRSLGYALDMRPTAMGRLTHSDVSAMLRKLYTSRAEDLFLFPS